MADLDLSDPRLKASGFGGVGSGEAQVKRWGRAAFQWGVIVAVVANVRAARDRGSAVTRRLGLAGVAGKALVGTRWRLTLDIGREPGTWMPP
jgi:hypothetical protein